jgi:hypothetical protein
VADVQTKRLALEQRRGALISRDWAVMKAFSSARMLRNRWLPVLALERRRGPGYPCADVDTRAAGQAAAPELLP